MPTEYLDNQIERRVENTTEFNGANCLVCINVPNLGSQLNSNWLQRFLLNNNISSITDAELDAVIEQDLLAKLNNCPENEPVKVQFLYHYSGGQIYEKDNSNKVGNRHWSQKDTVARVMRKLGQEGNDRIGKVYLTGCSSQEDKHVVDAAFSIASITHVVTINTTVALSCGQMTGLGWDYENQQPTFQDIPYKIIVWIKENGKQVAQIPDEEIDEGYRFNLNTNLPESNSLPMTGPCPTITPISGSGHREMRYYSSIASALADAQNVADGAASVDAGLVRNGHSCPNPKCTNKHLQRLRTAVTQSSGHSAWFRNLFYSDKKYYLYVAYSWTAEVQCSS